MRIAYHRRRLADFAAGLRLALALVRDQRRPRPELLRLQRERLEGDRAPRGRAVALLPRTHRRASWSGNRRVRALPVLTKAEMMERYDELVTNPRLKRDELLDWIARAGRDDHYLGEYRVMTTSGSSGRKGLFVYDRAAWRWVVAMFLRQSEMMGVAPRLPRRRIAAAHGASEAHMSRQVTKSVAVEVHRVVTLPVTMPSGGSSTS